MPRPHNRILVPLRDSFQKFRWALPSFLPGNPPRLQACHEIIRVLLYFSADKRCGICSCAFEHLLRPFNDSGKSPNKTVMSTPVTCVMCVLYGKCVAVLWKHQMNVKWPNVCIKLSKLQVHMQLENVSTPMNIYWGHWTYCYSSRFF